MERLLLNGSEMINLQLSDESKLIISLNITNIYIIYMFPILLIEFQQHSNELSERCFYQVIVNAMSRCGIFI